MGKHSKQMTGIGIGALLTLMALAIVPASKLIDATPAAAAASCPPPASQLENNGFESPRITTGTFQIVDQSTVPGWSTTAADGKMELWNSGFQGVPAAEGLQFAELNANLVSTLYQDIPTTPGQTLIWGLSHRGRQGVDTMNVRIGVPGSALGVVATVSDGNSAWGRHGGTYVVPAGQTVTRFAFESVSAAGGNKSIGNFLDAISFGTPACVTAEKYVHPDSGSVNVGDQVNYRIQVNNEGGSATTAASISDVLPLNTTYVPGNTLLNTGSTTIVLPDSVYNAGTRTITANLVGDSGVTGVIEPGTTVALYYSVTVDTAAAGTTLLNTANVSSTDGLGTVDAFTTNQTSTPVATAADLAIEKSATDEIVAGGTITYGLVVTNNGPSNVPGTVTVTDTLPAGATFDASPDGCTAVGQVVTCTAASLANGASTTFTFTATGANATPDPLLLINPASVSSAVHDPDLTNNTSEAATVVDPQAPAELLVTKSALTPTVNAGRRASVSILVTNIGQASTGNVTLTDTIPAGFTVESTIPPSPTCTTGATVSCNLGTIVGGETIRVIVVGRTAATLNAGDTLVDTATATDGTLTANDTATITIANASRLVTTKDTLNTPQADEPLLYAVNVANLGPSDADNAIVTDVLPAGVTVSAVEPSAGSCTTGATVTCNLGTLAVGDSATILYLVQLPVGGGTFINTATATSDSTNPNPGDATASTTTNVASGADLAITKVASASEVRSGESVTYTLTVTNQGPGTATGVEANDVAGAGIELTGATTATGTITVGADPLWAIGNLASGATVTATVTATITGGTGAYDNTAFVFATSEDPDGSDNTSIARVTIPGSGGTIANTGVESMPLTGTGALFLASGSALLAWARRRRLAGRAPVCLD